MNYGSNAKHMVLAVTVLPIKSNADAMAQYIGKYISKHLGSEKMRIKVKRLIASSSGWTKNSIRFLGLTTIPFCGVLTLPFSPEN